MNNEDPAKTIFNPETLKIITTALEHPKIHYSKTQLADVNQLSRNTVIRRIPALQQADILKRANPDRDTEKKTYQLNTDSETVNLLGQLLTQLNYWPDTDGLSKQNLGDE